MEYREIYGVIHLFDKYLLSAYYMLTSPCLLNCLVRDTDLEIQIRRLISQVKRQQDGMCEGPGEKVGVS